MTLPYSLQKQLGDLKKFKKPEQEIKNDYLDPEYQNWRDGEASQSQIKYVYVLAKMMGMSGREAEESWDFHYMTKGEITDLIRELQENLGIEPDNDWRNKKNNKSSDWKQQVRDSGSSIF